MNLKRLAAPSDLPYFPTIQYVYDPLPALPLRLNHPPFPLRSGATIVNQYSSRNAIHLDPFAAGLPYRSSIDYVHASKYWTANLGETLKLLEMLAVDTCTTDIEADHGIILAKLAKNALPPGHEHQIVLATQYMFPSADEQRIKQIAALMIIYFVFDDKVEETPNISLTIFRNDFRRRLQGHPDPNSRSSPLQNHIDDIVRGIEAEDAACGDGGKEMLEALRGAFRCVHPDKGFRNVDDYLQFRRENVGAAFVIAAAKFSIKSSVCTADPRFSRYLALISDHLGLVQTTWHPTTKNYALKITNVTSLQGTDEAKAVAWALQLQIERHMADELEGLKKGEITDDEWWFLEAVTSTAVGNVVFCMTTSRYGGKAARI